MISIIVPIYNVERHIEECIQSLLNQTYKDIKIILIDDGSPDKSPKICDQFSQQDQRIKVIHQENGGLSNARNRGIKEAKLYKSEYIMFVDGDDTIHPTTVEKLLNACLKNKTQIAACSLNYMSGQDYTIFEPIDEKRLDESIEVVSSHTIINRLWTSEYDSSIFTAVTCKLFNLSFFNDILHFREGIIYEDDDLATNLYLLNFQVAIVNSALYNWRMNPLSISHSSFSEKNCIFLDILNQRYHTFLSNNFTVAAQRAAKVFMETYIYFYFKAEIQGHKEWVLKHYLNSLKLEKACKNILSLKTIIRYRLFRMSPSIYRFLTQR